MVLACVIVGSHAYLVAAGAGGVDGHHARARIAGRSARSGTRSSSRRRTRRWPTSGYIGFYVLLYVGIVLLLRSRARSIGGTLWLDGVTAALAAAALGAAVLVELVLESTEGSTSIGRDEPRVPARRRAPAVRRLRRLLAHRLEARRSAGSSSGSASSRRRSPTPSTSSSPPNGTYVEGTWIDILWPTAMLLVASSAWAARSHARGARGRGSTAPRRPGRLRARRDGHPRLRPLHPREPARDRPRVARRSCSSSCGSRSRSARTAASSS